LQCQYSQHTTLGAAHLNNGGSCQFFQNTSRIFTPRIIEAPEQIGCPLTAQITRDAIAALNLPDLNTEPDVGDQYEALADALDSCDQRFYQSRELISSQLFAFVRENHAAIQI
jgi:hypothetical protein